MELPVDLWSIILQKINNAKQCKKLYLALPKNIKKELEEIYEEHKVKISINILCGIKNNMTLFQNGDLHTVFYQDHDFDTDIKFVRYVKNWYIINKEGDKIDCYISVSQNNTIMFWNAITQTYVSKIEIDSYIKEIEFHPTKPIMMVACDDLQVYIFDNNDGYTKKCSMTNVGNKKGFYFFHLTLPEIYIFSLSPGTTCCNGKLYSFMICDYETDFISFTDIIQTYFNHNFYKTPLKMNSDGSFECVKFTGAANYFCQFIITETDLVETNLQKIEENSEFPANLVIRDFIRIGKYVYFHTNDSSFDEEILQKYIQKFYRQSGNKSKIIYNTTNKLSKIIYKNNYLIFVDDADFKILDLETNTIDCFFRWKSKIDDYNRVLNDFCIL
jgi:hypothetical protein